MAPDPRPYRITVVCLGNICRSPIGEAILRRDVVNAGLADLVAVDSAGTGDWHIGHGADPRALAALRRQGVPLDHRARQIDPGWLDGIDLLLAMDEANHADLARMARGRAAPELRMLRTFDPDLAGIPEPDPRLAVPDPYYGQDADFDEVLAMIERASAGLVAELPARLGR